MPGDELVLGRRQPGVTLCERPRDHENLPPSHRPPPVLQGCLALAVAGRGSAHGDVGPAARAVAPRRMQHVPRVRAPARAGARGDATLSLVSFELVVNGAVQRLPAPPATVGDLVRALNLAGKRIAVERNGEIVPKSRYEETAVGPDDRFEIVAAVGGG